MSIKILTQNSIQVTNIDGARENNFAAGNRSGIVKGAFNEGNFFSASSNVIALDSCELLISGHRVVIDSAESITLTNRPSTNTRYSLVAEIVVNDASTPSFRLFVQSINTQLKQDNLYKTTNGFGTYQVEIGKFTLTTSGAITDVVRTIDVITGGKGNDDTGAINIGTITTNTLDSGMEAEVDVEQRFDSLTNKTLTDFTFSIPKGDTPDLSGYLQTSGGVVTGDLYTNKGITVKTGVGIRLNSKDDVQFMFYGDGSTQSVYTQVKKSDGSYGYSKLIDTDTKLYSQNKEVLSVAGGKMEGDINLSTNKGFSATTTSGNVYDIFRVDSANVNLTVGGTYPSLSFRGKNARPTYNGSDVALLSDVNSAIGDVSSLLDTINGEVV